MPVINPRGTNGSGKTVLARRILADYRWNEGGEIERIVRDGRKRPLGYVLRHPWGGRPLVVIGDYEKSSGGCDTITLAEGGLDEICRLADDWATAGADVLLEGSAVSAEYTRSAALAERHPMHILLLSTSAEQAARNLVARRRVGRSNLPLIERSVLTQRETVDAACSKLQTVAQVEETEFSGALDRARKLLGLTGTEGPAASLANWPAVSRDSTAPGRDHFNAGGR